MIHAETICLGYACFQGSLCSESLIETKPAHLFDERVLCYANIRLTTISEKGV